MYLLKCALDEEPCCLFVSYPMLVCKLFYGYV